MSSTNILFPHFLSLSLTFPLRHRLTWPRCSRNTLHQEYRNPDIHFTCLTLLPLVTGSFENAQAHSHITKTYKDVQSINKPRNHLSQSHLKLFLSPLVNKQSVHWSFKSPGYHSGKPCRSGD